MLGDGPVGAAPTGASSAATPSTAAGQATAPKPRAHGRGYTIPTADPGRTVIVQG